MRSMFAERQRLIQRVVQYEHVGRHDQVERRALEPVGHDVEVERRDPEARRRLGR